MFNNKIVLTVGISGQLGWLPYRNGYLPDRFQVTGSMEGERGRTGLLQYSDLVVDGVSRTAGTVAERRTVIFVRIAIIAFCQGILCFSIFKYYGIFITAGQTAQR